MVHYSLYVHQWEMPIFKVHSKAQGCLPIQSSSFQTWQEICLHHALTSRKGHRVVMRLSIQSLTKSVHAISKSVEYWMHLPREKLNSCIMQIIPWISSKKCFNQIYIFTNRVLFASFYFKTQFLCVQRAKPSTYHSFSN